MKLPLKMGSRPQQVFIAWLISAFLFVIFFAFFYIENKSLNIDSVISLSQRMNTAIARELISVSSFLENAESLSNACDQQTLNILKRQVFDSPSKSEIGIVTPQGYLICNSFGHVTPPVYTTEPLQQEGVRYHGSIISEYLGVPAFILSVTRDDGYEVNVLMPAHFLKNAIDINGLDNIDFAAVGDTKNGVPNFIQGEYSLPLNFQLFPAGKTVDFEGQADNSHNQFFSFKPIKGVPDLGLLVSSKSEQLASMKPLSMIGLGTVYIGCWGVLVILILAYEAKQCSTRAILLQALSRQEFRNVYQPLMSHQTERIVGVEVLIRWHHPIEGEIGPGYIIPEAKRDGSIIEISLQQIEQAKSELKEILISHPKLKVSFNVNGCLLNSESYINALVRTKQSIKNFTIELTERDMLSQDQVKSTLDYLAKENIEIAIDDFGTGYSGLQYLQSFPIDLLKIDQSFVASIGMDTLQTPVLNALVTMANQLEKKLIAEGVETDKQAMELSQSAFCRGARESVYEERNLTYFVI